ncbi:cyclin-dependent kinase inhibitor 1-like [Pleurodeles waltl]
MVNMCSSGSKSLEGACSRKVCRKLFGEVDHEQLKIDTEEMMSSCLEEAKQKWNFDFKNGIPLEGDFKWMVVGATEPQKLLLKEDLKGQKIGEPSCHQPQPVSGQSKQACTPHPKKEQEEEGNDAALTLSEDSINVAQIPDQVSSDGAQATRFSSCTLPVPEEASEPGQTLDAAEHAAVSTQCLKRKQTTLKDFYQAKRRSSQSSSKQSP